MALQEADSYHTPSELRARVMPENNEVTEPIHTSDNFTSTSLFGDDAAGTPQMNVEAGFFNSIVTMRMQYDTTKLTRVAVTILQWAL